MRFGLWSILMPGLLALASGCGDSAEPEPAKEAESRAPTVAAPPVDPHAGHDMSTMDSSGTADGHTVHTAVGNAVEHDAHPTSGGSSSTHAAHAGAPASRGHAGHD